MAMQSFAIIRSGIAPQSLKFAVLNHIAKGTAMAVQAIFGETANCIYRISFASNHYIISFSWKYNLRIHCDTYIHAYVHASL